MVFEAAKGVLFTGASVLIRQIQTLHYNKCKAVTAGYVQAHLSKRVVDERAQSVVGEKGLQHGCS